jgi:hypothetical protein
MKALDWYRQTVNMRRISELAAALGCNALMDAAARVAGSGKPAVLVIYHEGEHQHVFSEKLEEDGKVIAAVVSASLDTGKGGLG